MKLNSEFAIVNEWFKWNKLSLNLKTTKYMLFGTRAELNQTSITSVSQKDQFEFQRLRGQFGHDA